LPWRCQFQSAGPALRRRVRRGACSRATTARAPRAGGAGEATGSAGEGPSMGSGFRQGVVNRQSTRSQPANLRPCYSRCSYTASWATLSHGPRPASSSRNECPWLNRCLARFLLGGTGFHLGPCPVSSSEPPDCLRCRDPKRRLRSCAGIKCAPAAKFRKKSLSGVGAGKLSQ
jgi:hypothetical protein